MESLCECIVWMYGLKHLFVYKRLLSLDTLFGLLCDYRVHKSFNQLIMTIFGGLLKRVVKVRVEGNINQKMTDDISIGLRGARFFHPEAVVISINSPGGSLAQAKHINDIIRNYAIQNNAPVHCFALDQCLGSATAILTSGVKAYANEMSLLGDFGYGWSTLWFKKFADKYNVRQEYIFSGQNKVKFNPFEDIKPESEKWMQNYLYLLEHDLKSVIIANRQQHFTKLNYDSDQIEKQVFSGSVIQPERAREVGLIDDIMNEDDLLNHALAGVKVYHVNKRNKFDRIKKAMQMVRLAE